LDLAPDLVRKMVAELIGTFMLVFCGTGAIIASVEGDGTIGPLAYIFGFGFALIFIVYAIRHISGAHVNPAVTLGLALSGNFPMAMVPFYWGAQIVGAVLASSILRLTFGNVANLGASEVSSGFSVLNGLVLEIVLAAILVFVAHAALTDERFPKAASGLAIGGALLVIQVVGGPVTGGSVNPARSIGPALLSNTYNDLWIYLIAPFIGAVIGALAYEYLRPASADDDGNMDGVRGVVRDSRGGPPRRTRDTRAERQRRERAEHQKSRPRHTDHGDPVDRPGRKARPQVDWDDADADAEPDAAALSERPQRAERTERADRSSRSERPNRRERAERPPGVELSERPERAERPTRRERTERTDVPPRRERMEWTERPERATRAERPVEQPVEPDDAFEELDVDVDEFREPMPPTLPPPTTPPRNTR